MTAAAGTVIVNADDFGMSSAVNHAIVYCFQRGLISSTTMLVNLEGFEEACELAREQGLADRIGIHINLTEGRPLVPELSDNPSLCDAAGHFRRQRALVLRPHDQRQIAAEIAAQIDRCRSRGLSLTHADSHQHVHNEPWLFPVFRRALKRAGIPFLRISRTMSDGGNWSVLKTCGKAAFNGLVQLSGLRCTQQFVSVGTFERMRVGGHWQKSSWEIITHPAFDNHGVLVDHVEGQLLEVRLTRVFNGIRLVSFAEAGQSPRSER
jgi:predicted glycoside hydrolase/deacetylase ChbG (UPF0249 family)